MFDTKANLRVQSLNMHVESRPPLHGVCNMLQTNPSIISNELQVHEQLAEIERFDRVPSSVRVSCDFN